MKGFLRVIGPNTYIALVVIKVAAVILPIPCPTTTNNYYITYFSPIGPKTAESYGARAA